MTIMNLGGTVKVNTNAVFIVVAVFFCIIVLFNYNSSSRPKEIKQVNLKEVLAASIDAAVRGGKKVYEIRENSLLNEESKGKTKEGANNPVTDGDMQSHLEMYHSIRKAFPYIMIVSEEKDSHKLNDLSVDVAKITKDESEFNRLENEFVKPSDILVWIDPLDATQEYTENLREYVTTMVCIAVKGVPVIGVIHKPFQHETYWSWLKHGHSLPASDKFLNMRASIEKGSRVIVSRSHAGEVKKFATDALGNDSVITPAGGAGFKALEVLKQTQDVYVHTTLIKKWDICAGNAILNYFNGTLTTLKGDSISYGDSNDYKNEGGLIASLNNKEYYIAKLKALSEKSIIG